MRRSGLAVDGFEFSLSVLYHSWTSAVNGLAPFLSRLSVYFAAT